MLEPEDVLDIFLQPGETYFGDQSTRIRTILGSCVSMTLWHPRLRIGGMCHFMLPRRGHRISDSLDGRYGEEAMVLLVRDIQAHNTRAADYEAKLFGGGAMFPSQALNRRNGEDVGQQNVRSALELIAMYGFHLKAKHLGGLGHRNVIFELWSGDVWMRHIGEMVGNSTEKAAKHEEDRRTNRGRLRRGTSGGHAGAQRR